MPSASDIARQVWLTALSEPIGLGVVVSAPLPAKNYLYAARKSLGIPELANFTIRTSPTNPAAELWIIRTRRQPPPTSPTEIAA